MQLSVCLISTMNLNSPFLTKKNTSDLTIVEVMIMKKQCL